MNHIELPEAELRPLLDFEGYWAGADGKIYSMRMSRGREYRPLKPGLGSTGYQHVNLPVEDGVCRPRLVHILVAEAFHGARPEGVEVSHQNGNYLDNRPTNLAWETKIENRAKRKLHGTDDEGLKNTRACVDSDSLEEIRTRITGGGTNKSIAEEFDVSPTTISRIRNGRRFQND